MSTQPCCPPLEDLLDPELFKALADPTRLTIMMSVARCCGSMTVSEVAERTPIDRSVVSRHLNQLKKASIVSAERRGREVHYVLRANALAAKLRELADAVEACCDNPVPAGTPPTIAPAGAST